MVHLVPQSLKNGVRMIQVVPGRGVVWASMVKKMRGQVSGEA